MAKEKIDYKKAVELFKISLGNKIDMLRRIYAEKYVVDFEESKKWQLALNECNDLYDDLEVALFKATSEEE